jgi:glycosyltransferase involved in cell wall biosynthesis
MDVDVRPARVLWQPFFYFPERWNGIDEHLLLLARHLDRKRYELLLLTHESDGPQSALLAQRAGIRTVAAPYAPRASFLTRLRALRRLYRQEGIDLLHLHSPVVGGQLAPTLAARLAGAAGVLATYHQVQPWIQSRRTRLLNAFIHTLLMCRTLAVSEDVRATMAARTGVPAAQVEVVHNGIDASASGSARSALAPPGLPPRRPDEVRLGCFGRLSPEKGLEVVLEAMGRLATVCPEARLLIAGDGPKRPTLVDLAERLGITDRVEFLGFRDDARDIMASVDIVVHAPAYEGFGLVVLEAMDASRPVVVNDAPGGLKDTVVPEQTGLVVPSGSATALAAALQRLVGDPAARRRLGEAGRARFLERFTAPRTADVVAGQYQAVLRQRRPRAGEVTRRPPAVSFDQ